MRENGKGDHLIACLPEESWFRRYMSLWPLAEAPKSYILYSALSMMGAALGRTVYFDQDIHILFPMLNLLLIGPSGIGKSTAIKMGLNLLTQLPPEVQPNIIKGKATKEALHEELEINPHAVIVASELANLFSKEKYMEGMIPYVTQLLDYEPEASIRTKSGGRKTVKNPSATFVGGSTVEWLQEQMPNTATAGGFLPRFFIIKEDHKGQRVPNPQTAMGPRQRLILDRRRAEVFEEFICLSQMYQGPIDYIDYAASDTYAFWYLTHTPESGNLSPFSARAGEYVLRFAMILAISCGRTAIAKEDVTAAIELYRYSTSKLQEVVVPFTAQGRMLSQLLAAIGEDEVSDIQLRRAMRNHCSAQDVDKLITSLLASKDVVQINGKFRRNHGR